MTRQLHVANTRVVHWRRQRTAEAALLLLGLVYLADAWLRGSVARFREEARATVASTPVSSRRYARVMDRLRAGGHSQKNVLCVDILTHKTIPQL